jgi:NADPH:quinone reductase-like Zn-dependent oxidoreductase
MGYHGPQTTAERAEFSRITESRGRDSRLLIGARHIHAHAPLAPASPRSTRSVIPGPASGDIVAVHGVGGLGHLGIQFAARQGFRTVAVNRGRDKEELARKLGASDTSTAQRRTRPRR